jgi:hypothetical protein
LCIGPVSCTPTDFAKLHIGSVLGQ